MEEIEELKELIKKRRKDIIKIGKILNKIKKNKSIKFSKILQNIGLSRRTANYYMKIAQLEDADKLVDEIGYTKLIILLEAKKINKETIELAKELSVSKLKEMIKEENKIDEVEEIKRDLKKIIKKSSSIEIFKKAFIELVNELKVKN